ncbi:hypothetical protein BDD12DRAFT_223224 [Trichophaea hybrida]|nr:hypothetical protein BDD12DRAFT_223224 [Trichophaea hybrida]
MAPTKNRKPNIKFVKKSNSQRAAAQASKQRVVPSKPVAIASKKRPSTEAAASSEQPTSGPDEAKDSEHSTVGPLNPVRTEVSQTSDSSSGAQRRKWSEVVLGPSVPVITSQTPSSNAVLGDKTNPITFGDDLDNLDTFSYFPSPIPIVGCSPYSPDKILAEADNILARTIEVASPTPSFKSVESVKKPLTDITTSMRSKSVSPIRHSSPKHSSIMDEHFRKAFSYPPSDIVHPSYVIDRSSEDPPARSIVDSDMISSPDRYISVGDSADSWPVVKIVADDTSTRIRSPTSATNENSRIRKSSGEAPGGATSVPAVKSISDHPFGVASSTATAQNIEYKFPASSSVSMVESANAAAPHGHGIPNSTASNSFATIGSATSPASTAEKATDGSSTSITGPKSGHSLFSDIAQHVSTGTPLTHIAHSLPALLDVQPIQREIKAITAGPDTTMVTVQTDSTANTRVLAPNPIVPRNAEVSMADRIVIKQEWPTLQDAMRSILSPQPPGGGRRGLQAAARDSHDAVWRDTATRARTRSASPPRVPAPGSTEPEAENQTDMSLSTPVITTSTLSGSVQNATATEIADDFGRFSSPLSDLSEKDMKFEDIDDSQTIQATTVTTTPRATRKATQQGQQKVTRGRRNSASGIAKTSNLPSGQVGGLPTSLSDTVPMDIDTEGGGKSAARGYSNDQSGILRAIGQAPDHSTPNKRGRKPKNAATSSSARQAPARPDPTGGPARNTRKRKHPPVVPVAPTLAASRPARTAAIRAREVIHDVATGRRSRSLTAELKEEEKPELPTTKRRRTNRDRSNTADTKPSKVEEPEKKPEHESSVPVLRKTTRSTRRQTQTIASQQPSSVATRRATRSAGTITTATNKESGSAIQAEPLPPDDGVVTTEIGTTSLIQVESTPAKSMIVTTETESGNSIQAGTVPAPQDMGQRPPSPAQHGKQRPNSPSLLRQGEEQTSPSPIQYEEIRQKSPSPTLRKEEDQKPWSSIHHVEETRKSPSPTLRKEDEQKPSSSIHHDEETRKSPSPPHREQEKQKSPPSFHAKEIQKSSSIQQEEEDQRSPPPKPASPTQQLLQEANVPRTGQPTTRRRLTRDQEHDMLLREADESLSSYLAEDNQGNKVLSNQEAELTVVLVRDSIAGERAARISQGDKRSERPTSLPPVSTEDSETAARTDLQAEHSEKPGSLAVPAADPTTNEAATRIDSQAVRSPSPPFPETSISPEHSLAFTPGLSSDSLENVVGAVLSVELEDCGEVVTLLGEPDALEAAKNLVDLSNKPLAASSPLPKPPTAPDLGPKCALCSRALGEIKALRANEGLLSASDDEIFAEHVEFCLSYTGAEADFGNDTDDPSLELASEPGLEDDTEAESIEATENYDKDGQPTRTLPYYIQDVPDTGNTYPFTSLTALDEYRKLLNDPGLTPEEQLAVEESLVFSLHSAQEEWYLLEQIACAKGAAAPKKLRKGTKAPQRRRDPFKPEDPIVYEDKKEAALYSYDNSSNKYSMRREGLRTRQKHLDPIIVPGYEFAPGVPQTMEPKLTRGRNKNETSSARETTTPAPAHATGSSKVPRPATAANSGRSTPAVITGDQPVKRGPGRPRKDGLAPGSRPVVIAAPAATTVSAAIPSTSTQVSQSMFKISFGMQGRESMKGILSRDVSPGTSHPSTPANGPSSTAIDDSNKQSVAERSKVGAGRGGMVAVTGTGRKRGRPKKADVAAAQLKAAAAAAAALIGPPRLQLNIPNASGQFSSFPVTNEAHGTSVTRRSSTTSNNDMQRPVRGKTYKTPTSIEAPLPKPTMEEEFKAAASSTNLGPRVRKRRLDDGDLAEAPAKKTRRNEVDSTSAT